MQTDSSATEQTASVLQIKTRLVELRSPEGLEPMYEAVLRDRPEALIVVADPLTMLLRAQLVRFAAEHHLPAIYGTREFVEAGGLMSYGTNVASLFNRAAYYVDRILRGAHPADLPVEQPPKFDLVVNLKAARGLGLTVPQSLLLRADEVIQ
jgi:putative ABC transport system substrate-binding protein